MTVNCFVKFYVQYVKTLLKCHTVRVEAWATSTDILKVIEETSQTSLTKASVNKFGYLDEKTPIQNELPSSSTTDYGEFHETLNIGEVVELEVDDPTLLNEIYQCKEVL